MKWFVLIVCCVELALSLPQGYNYKDPLPGVGDSNLGGFRPIQAPCNHGPNAAGLVQQQSIGRIINNNHQDVVVAGGGHDSQAVTVNSHIVVGDGGHSQVFREGHGYSEQNRVQPAHIPLPLPLPVSHGPALPASGPAQAFVQTAQQQFGSNQNSFASSFSTINGGGAIVNGIGKVPPPPQALSGGYQYASGFGGSKHSIGPGFGGPIRGPLFTGAPINPNFIAGGPRPIGGGQKFVSGAGFQGSNSFHQNVGGFQSGSQFQGNGGGAHIQSIGGGGQFQGGSAGFSHGSGSQSFGIESANLGGNAILNGALGNVIRETFANAPLDPTVEKHIYVHVPPEDLEEHQVRQQIHLPEAPAKKHYKIIFIKAPTVNTQTNYAQIANAAGVSEEKTIVYVLVKKPEEPSIQEIQQIQQNIKPSKPEVYFIKYKTKKEEGPAGGFIGGGYNANIDLGSQQTDFISNGPIAGSDLAGPVDIGVTGTGSGIDTFQSGGSFSSSSSSSSGVSNGEAVGGAPHAVYGVPNVK